MLAAIGVGGMPFQEQQQYIQSYDLNDWPNCCKLSMAVLFSYLPALCTVTSLGLFYMTENSIFLVIIFAISRHN